jgi:hypothetical protein
MCDEVAELNQFFGFCVFGMVLHDEGYHRGRDEGKIFARKFASERRANKAEEARFVASPDIEIGIVQFSSV